MRQLEAVGYYRLCAYWYPFKQADSSFVPGTSFDVVWNRYVFDRQLRLAVMDAIERVEIAIRTALVTELAMRHGAFAHVDPKKFPSAHHARLWNRELAIRPTVPDVKNGPEWHRPQSIDTNRMFVVLTILRFLLHRVATQSAWRDRLFAQFDRFPDVPLASMGMDAGWRQHTLWR